MRALFALLMLSLVLPVTPVLAQSQPPPAPTGPISEVLLRGGAAVQAGDFEQAVVDYSLFLLLNPTDPRAYFLRGMSYYNLDHLDLAIDDMTQALRHSARLPELHASALATRSEFYALQGQNEAAVHDLDSLIEFRPTPDAFFQRAMFRLEAEAFDDAIADLSEAIDLTTGPQPDLFFYRAHAHAALQNQQQAADDFYEWVNGIGVQTADGGPLLPGGALTLQMTQSLVYRISLSAKRGEEINILARNVSGDVNPLFVLLGPDGTPLVASDDVVAGRDRNALVTGFPAPESGDYELLVTHSIIGYAGRVQVLLEIR